MFPTVCSSPHSSESDYNCPTPDSILVTSPVPQVQALEVLPHFFVSWDLSPRCWAFVRGPGVPPVPLLSHLVSTSFLSFEGTL